MILEPDLLLTIILLWILLAMLLSPLEALVWWAGWIDTLEETTEPKPEPPIRTAQHKYFAAYLTGIASVAEDAYLPREQRFLAQLAARLSDGVLVDDIFPYSVTNRPLTGQRVFSWFWRYIFQRKESGSPVGFLINMRNLFQVMVSADNRYGPIYNQGAAQIILHGLRRHGYPLGSGLPIILIGYSGGGQICLGAVPYLKDALNAPVILISLGGVLSADPGILEIDHLYHVHGSRDWVQSIGSIVFPGRWPFMANSNWNRARAQGRITIIRLPGVKHTGRGGYLDTQAPYEGAETNLDTTIRTITSLIEQYS